MANPRYPLQIPRRAEEMYFKGDWASGVTYHPGDVVVDDGWQMIANTGTVEKPAPVPVGEPFFAYTGASPTTTDNAKQIIMGLRVTAEIGGYLTAYRIHTVAGDDYRVFLVTDPLGSAIKSELISFTSVTSGWVVFNINPVLVGPGFQFDIVVVASEPDPTPVVVTANYSYTTPNNENTPTAGNIVHADKNTSSFKINKTDDDATDRSVLLEALTIGDIIDGANQRWSIQAITDNTTWMDFEVAPASQGVPNGLQEFSFETVIATPITHIEDVDYWLGNANVRGLFAADIGYPNIIVDDNQYSVDIQIQLAVVSDDWDAISFTGSAGAGGQPSSKFYNEMITAPVTITEGDGWVTLVTLTIDNPTSGWWDVAGVFTAAFTSANDKLEWRATGTLTQGTSFLVESKDAAEVIPVSVEASFNLTGSTETFNLEVMASGPGAADVEIQSAQATARRPNQ
jgi:hypothetical protein